MHKRGERNSYRVSEIIFVALFSLLFITNFAFGAIEPTPPNLGKNNKVVLEKALKIQMPFIVNQGQIADEHVRFYAKTFGRTVFVTDQGEMVYSFSVGEPKPPLSRLNPRDRHQKPEEVKIWTLKEKLVGSLQTMPMAIDKAEAKVNYFIGNDKSKWKTDITTHNEVSLGEIYKGIDLKLKAYGKNIEKVFTVKPGADTTAIKLKMDGASSLKVNDKGELEAGTGYGPVSFGKPVAYQEINGKRLEVKVVYLLEKSTLDTQHSSPSYGFKVGDYDMSYPLVIDPVLSYSTYLGGSGYDFGYGIAVDGFGNVYVTGQTLSTDFPTQNPIQGANGGGYDAFVTKINASGTALVYSTYLGGALDDYGLGIAVDASGNVYVTGRTYSTNFPTLNAIQETYVKSEPYGDGFVTKINASGNALVYSTYLGGTGDEQCSGIAVDASGNAYVTGYTSSTNFPTLNPIQANNGGVYNVFVTEINASGNALVYSTYLGGAGDDYAQGIAVDASGNVYVTGGTNSTNFPTLNPIQATNAGGEFDVFVTKIGINADGYPYLVYSTYLGGTGTDYAQGIAVDASGNAYVTGYTGSTNFPTLNPIQANNAGGYDVFVTEINASGRALVYSTYLGGTGDEQGYGIAVDGSGNVYVTGATTSTNFPTQNPIQATNAGIAVFVTEINASGSALVYSTYLGGGFGGESSDYGYGIAVDGFGNVYITGQALSTNFPTLNPIQANNAGGWDAFVAKISGQSSPLPVAIPAGGTYTSSLDVGLLGDTGTTIFYTTDGSTPTTPTTGTTTEQYTTPIQISAPTTLNFLEAYPLAEGMWDQGPVKTAVYTIQPSLSASIAPLPAQVWSGGSIPVTATFYNGPSNILTMNPDLDCIGNIFFEVIGSNGPLLPRCRIRTAYGIPADVVTIPAAGTAGSSFTANCYLSDMYDPSFLVPGSYLVQAFYSNYVTDPNIVNGQCTAPNNQCYNLWTGAIASAPVTLTLAADTTPPVTTLTFGPGPRNPKLPPASLVASGSLVSTNGTLSFSVSCFDTPGLVANFSATDDLSGVQQINYTLAPVSSKIGGQTGSGAFVSNSGSLVLGTVGLTNLTYYSTDRAGNSESPHTELISVGPLFSCGSTPIPKTSIPAHAKVTISGTLTINGKTTPFSISYTY